MAKTKMSWSWIGDWPIFVYTTWIAHRLDKNVFHVKIVLGEKGNQNAGYTGPNAPSFLEYEDYRFISKQGAFYGAMEVTARWLKYERRITELEYSDFIKNRWKFV